MEVKKIMGDTPYYPYHPNGQGDQPEREGAVQDPVTGGYLSVDPVPYPAGAPVYPTYSGSYASPAAPPAAPVIEPPKHYEVPNYDALLSSRPRPTRRKRPEISSTQTAAPARPVLPDAAPTASRVHRRSAAERQSAQPVSVPTVATPSPAQTPGVNRPSPVVVDLRREEARPAAAVKPVAPPVVVEVKKVRKGSAVQPVVVPVPQTVRDEEPRRVEILTPPDAQGDARPQPEESAASALPVVEPALPQSPEPREASPRPEERPAVEPAPEAEAFAQQEEHGATAAATTFSAYSQSEEQDLSSLVEEFLSMNLKPASEPVTQPVPPAQTAAAEPVAPPALQPAPLEEPERPAPRVFDFAAPSPVPEAEPFEAPPLRPEPVRESEPVLVKRHDEERSRAGMPLFGIGFDAPMDAPIEPIVIEPVIPAPPEELAAVKEQPEEPEARFAPAAPPEAEIKKAPQAEPAPPLQAEIVTFTDETPVPVSEGEPSFVFDNAKTANGFETITFDEQPAPSLEADLQAQPEEAPPVETDEPVAELLFPDELPGEAEPEITEEAEPSGDGAAFVETLPEPAPQEDELPVFETLDAEPEFINFAVFDDDTSPQALDFPAITELLDEEGGAQDGSETAEQPIAFDGQPAPILFETFENVTEPAQEIEEALPPAPQPDGAAPQEPPVPEDLGEPVIFERLEDAPVPPQDAEELEPEPAGQEEPAPSFGLFSDEAPALEPMPEPAFGAFGSFESETDGPAEEPAQLEIPGALNGLSDFDMTVDSEPETEKLGGFSSFEELSGEGEADEAEFGGFGSFGAFDLPQEADEPTAEFGGFGSFAQQDAALHVNEPTEEFNGFSGARAAEEPAAEPGLSGNLFDTAFIPPAGNAGLSDIDDIANNLDQAMLAKTYNQAFTDNNLLADSGRAGLTVRGLNSEYFVSKHGATPGAMFENVGFTVNDGACLAIVSDIPLASYTLARAVAECFDDGEEELVSVSDAQTGEEREILYAGSDEMIPDEMTCIEFLLYSLSAVYGETHEEREERVRVALSQVGMGDLEEEPLADLSHNKRLLILGLSAALNPNIGCVIFNDSRFNIEGVEENMARRVFALLASSGKSVVLSCCSRYLMATVANRVLVLKGGQAVFDSSYREFIDSNCPGILSFTSRNPQSAMAYLQERFPDISALNKGNLIYLVRNDSREVDIEQLLKSVADSGADYNSVVIDDKSFDAALREVLGA